MDEGDQVEPPGDRGRRVRRTLVGAGAALGLTLAGLGIAAAQTDSSTTTTAPPEHTTSTAASAHGGAVHSGRHDGGGEGHGLGIHGDFTTRAPGGGYQTLATQVGEITSVNSSSITVKSEDGYSRTYTVDDNTLVNAGNNGIDDVKTGHQVRVLAHVAGGQARAVDIVDTTQVGQLHQRWAPPHDANSGTPTHEGTTAS